MATLADSLISSASRPLNLRKRPDLETRRHFYQGRPYIVVKEPVGLKYFRFQEEEYAILEMIDGRTSLDQIKERFERRFAPEKITLQDLQNFIGMLHRSGLVIASVSGQGKQLFKRRGEARRKKMLGMFTNVLALRWKGIDPEWMLNALYPLVRWMFHPAVVALCLAIMVSALGLVLVHFDEFRGRLPAFHEFFGPANWWKMALVMAVVKVIHEFGHGLSCKHFGGECHEMGVMLLVLTPCLYCNVSDSWMLPNKWHRAIIGAAGMYIEVLMASIATFIWWFTVPGTLNFICLSVMFICSVSTLIFNGNPLLRFDGYYILSDILEIPNLRQKATEVLKRYLTELCLGLEQHDDPFLPKKGHFFFGFYTIAAVAYRWVVLASILLFLNAVLKPYGLQILGQLIALTAIIGLFVQPGIQLYRFFQIPGRMHQVKKARLAATLGVVAAVVAGIALLPLPHHVNCVLEVTPRDAEYVYVDTAGQLAEVLVQPRARVQKGEPLARLSNTDLELQVVDLQGRLAQYDTQLASLQRERLHNPDAARTIPQVVETKLMVEEQLAKKQSQLRRLTITAPLAGMVFAPPSKPAESADGRLPAWSGTPMEPKNQHAWLSESELFCQIGDPKMYEARLIVPQSDIEFVERAHRQYQKAAQEGQTGNALAGVRIKLDAYPALTLQSRIVEIAEIDMKAAPKSLSNTAGGDLATVTDPRTGMQKPLDTSYQAIAPLDDPDELLRNGLRGRAKVYVGYQPLGQRLWRFLTRTFHFDL